MESKNILLVVICVCAFLVIVFGIALWFTLPKNGQAKGPVDLGGESSSFSGFDALKNNDEPPGIAEQTNPPNQSNELSLVVGEKQDDNTLLSRTPEPVVTENPALMEKPKDDESDIVMLKIPLSDKPETTKKPVTITKKNTEYTEKKPQPTNAPQKKTTKNLEYWIQAGSYKSKSLAETQSAKLTDHGFSSQLITREVGGTLYYRVRIGPYANSAEAEKFLSWIKVIDGMEDSYVSQLSVQRNLN